jgi:hypothetical protein
MLGRELPKARRLEYISTIDPKRHATVDLIVRRLGTLGVFKSLRVKSVEAKSHEGMQTVDLGYLQDLFSTIRSSSGRMA